MPCPTTTRCWLTTSLLSLLISACGFVELPEYWLCRGNSLQELRTHSGHVLATYPGPDQVLLERYKDSVFQFNAPALFGLYVVCPGRPDQLVFRAADCSPEEPSADYREGVLNVINGQLSFNDRREVQGHVAVVHAEYQCRLLGHTYTFRDLGLPDAH